MWPEEQRACLTRRGGLRMCACAGKGEWDHGDCSAAAWTTSPAERGGAVVVAHKDKRFPDEGQQDKTHQRLAWRTPPAVRPRGADMGAVGCAAARSWCPRSPLRPHTQRMDPSVSV